MDQELEWLENTLNKNTFDKAIHKLESVDEKSAVDEGNNACSALKSVTLNVILRSGHKTRITLIVKRSLEDKETAEMLENNSFFKKEITMYNTVLPLFNQLLQEYQDRNDKLWCNLIGNQSHNLIVLEDLKEKNYKMADRIAMLDKCHTLLAMHSLARFHAMGHVLIKKGLIKKDKLGPHYFESGVPETKNFIIGGLRKLCDVILNDWDAEWKEVSERLSERIGDTLEKLEKSFSIPEDSFITLCHGDCWTCNLMFKYCPYDESMPVAVKFIDFQCSHVNSYAFDIILLLCAGAQPEVRRTHWNELLSEYQKTLSSSLSLYGVECKAPTLENIQTELKRLEHYAMVVQLVNLPITRIEIKNPLDFKKLTSEHNCADAFNPEIFNTENYKNAVQIELKKWVNEGVFNITD